MENNFTERLKRFRKKAGLNQEELAFQIGVSVMTVRRWEWGKYFPRADEIKKLASALHVSEEELLNEEPSQQNWVLQIKINRDLQGEFIDMRKSVPCISDLTITPQGCFLSLGGNFELWTDDKKYKSFQKALTKARKIIVQNAKELGFIKEVKE